MNILVNILPVCIFSLKIYGKFEAKLKLQLMNAAVSIILRAAPKQEGIDRQQVIKTKGTSITDCHIFVVTNNMQNKYYSTKLFQKRFKTMDVIEKNKIKNHLSLEQMWKK